MTSFPLNNINSKSLVISTMKPSKKAANCILVTHQSIKAYNHPTAFFSLGKMRKKIIKDFWAFYGHVGLHFHRPNLSSLSVRISMNVEENNGVTNEVEKRGLAY